MAANSHVKVKNATGKSASDLHITFSGTGGSLKIDPASVRPTDGGDKPPKIPSNEKDSTNEATIEWSNPVVPDSGEVEFDAATLFGPLEFIEGYWTGPTEEGARSNIGPVKKEDIQIASRVRRDELPSFKALSDSVADPDFLSEANKAAIAGAKANKVSEILKRVPQWLPVLAASRNAGDLLRVPFVPAGTEIGNFIALSTLFFAPPLRDCSACLQRLMKANEQLNKAEADLASAKADLKAAEQELQDANQALNEAERKLKAAQENTNHQTGHLIIPDPWTLPFSPLAGLYEAAFRQMVRRAQDRADRALWEVKNLTELVNIRKKKVDDASKEYFDALTDWLRCLAGF